jgi:hypothetical protein
MDLAAAIGAVRSERAEQVEELARKLRAMLVALLR